ncbi:MAG TPA: lanthionine synthetase LanC family protein [Burkholderiaceae bacterium]|nr:lanthionine synthetase LanC family protein [Burkholderiaceae bacterium]
MLKAPVPIAIPVALSCALSFPLSFACAQTTEDAAAKAPASRTPALRDAVQKAIAWIGRQAVPVEGHEDAVTFPGTAEQPDRRSAIVYGGGAGVLIFLENAAKVLGDEHVRALADRTANGLLATARKDEHGRTWVDPKMREGAAALYVGDAGVGAAFLARARLRGDAAALLVATEVGDALLARAQRDGDALGWDHQVEVIYGTAGTALFLLELAAAVPDGARFRDGALAAGRHLIASSKSDDKEPGRRYWRWALAGNATYTGFSHGTAGVAYALLRIGLECKDDACVQAAKDGAEWLQALAVRDGELVHWPVAPKSSTSMGGWCHGPPGTARLFLLLYGATKEQRWLDTALGSARWVMAQAGPADAKIPPAFPPSFCCGVAGAVDFFCDLQRATGDAQYGAFAARAADYLLAKAEADGDGIKWANGVNDQKAAAHLHSVDLMLGASGEAFALLRVLTLGDAADPVVGLPDRRLAPAPAPVTTTGK